MPNLIPICQSYLSNHPPCTGTGVLLCYILTIYKCRTIYAFLEL